MGYERLLDGTAGEWKPIFHSYTPQDSPLESERFRPD